MQQAKLTLFRLDYLLGTAIIACQVMNQQSLTSLFFYVTFLVSAALWLCTTMERFDWLDCLALFIVFLAFVHVSINGIIAGADFSFQYFKKYIMFCCTVIFLAAARKITIDKMTFRILELLFFAIGALLLFMYVFKSRQMHLLNGQYTRYLTFRFTNPNLTALFLACMIMFLEITGFQERNTIVRILLFSVAIVETVFLYQTESRNALLAVIVFTVFSVLFFLRKRKLRLKKGFLWLVAVLPLFFAIIYLRLVDYPNFSELFAFAISEGKDLDSRVSIWSTAFRAFAASPILGAYYQISGGTGTSQFHNTHVDILASYGILVLGLVCVFLYGLMREKNLKACSSVQDSALLGFICALLLGIGEAALFSGGLGIYLFFGIFLGLANEQQRIDECDEPGLYQ